MTKGSIRKEYETFSPQATPSVLSGTSAAQVVFHQKIHIQINDKMGLIFSKTGAGLNQQIDIIQGQNTLMVRSGLST